MGIDGAGKYEEVGGIDDLAGLNLGVTDHLAVLDGDGGFLFSAGQNDGSATDEEINLGHGHGSRGWPGSDQLPRYVV